MVAMKFKSKRLRLVLKILFFIIVAFNLFLGSWYVLNNDITFTADVARDFFLFAEISTKKIVLIGPRSSAGLFHGPLWTYLNYPAYFIGQGNPLAVGWYWLFLIVLFLFGSYYIAERLFNKTVAYLYVLMESVYMAFHTHLMNNPHGALLVLPTAFYFFIRYWETLKLRYLIAHLVMTSFMVQFQLALGIPFLMLSFAAIVYKSFRSGKKAHLLAYSLLTVLLGNFIIFDLRHNFLLSRLVLDFISPTQHGQTFNYLSFVYDRVRLMLSAAEIVRLDRGYRNLIIFLMLLFFLYQQIKDNKYKTVYLSFLYFYVGFFLLSFIDKGPLLYFYLFPLFPFVHLIFASFVLSRYKKFFLIIFFAIFIFNVSTLITDTRETKKYIGKDASSWKFLYNLAAKVYEGPEKEFGYFVFAPDIVGFGPKYAMRYAGQIYKKPAYSFQKKPVTYFVIEPHPYYKSDWWRVNKVHLTGSPASAVTFPNGYKIEKYNLTSAEIQIPTEPDIDLGIFFR